jgi:hypothetical protein
MVRPTASTKHLVAAGGVHMLGVVFGAWPAMAVTAKPTAPARTSFFLTGAGKIKSDHISSFLRYIDIEYIAQRLAFCKFDISKKLSVGR